MSQIFAFQNWNNNFGTDKIIVKLYFFQTVDKLSVIYEQADDIDLVVGMMAETPLPGSLIGPTATCLLRKSFLMNCYVM